MITVSPSSRPLYLRLALIAILLSTLACSLAGPSPVISSPTPSPTMDVHLATVDSPTWTPEIQEPAISRPGMIFWAMQSFSDSSTADPDWTNGEPDVTDCTAPMLTTWAPLASDGGDDLYGQAAVNPVDGNLYVLKDKTILVYTTDTAELLREISLDEVPSYASLAFDPQGRLFTLRNPGWQPELLQFDPQAGAELDAIPLVRASQYPIEIVARDLAIDARGNFYVLFAMNTGQIAVHVLDPQGNFLRRFGRLTSDMDDWTEGAFLDPRAIAVTPDGRFILVADGYDETSYLSAFLMEPEQ